MKTHTITLTDEDLRRVELALKTSSADLAHLGSKALVTACPSDRLEIQELYYALSNKYSLVLAKIKEQTS